jgi:hypothetical protein
LVKYAVSADSHEKLGELSILHVAEAYMLLDPIFVGP